MRWQYNLEMEGTVSLTQLI